MYRFFESPADRSEALAHQWGIDYAALCDADRRRPATPSRTRLEPIPNGGATRLYRIH